MLALIERGADASVRDNAGKTAAIHAKEQSNDYILSELRKAAKAGPRKVCLAARVRLHLVWERQGVGWTEFPTVALAGLRPGASSITSGSVHHQLIRAAKRSRGTRCGAADCSPISMGWESTGTICWRGPASESRHVCVCLFSTVLRHSIRCVLSEVSRRHG